MLVMHVGVGTTRGALTVFPVWTEGPEPAQDHLLFGPASEQGAVSVGELPQPSVQLVAAVNAAMLPVLLVEGEAIVGGQQDRVVVATTLLPPMGEAQVPVACVEARRWHGTPQHLPFGRVSPTLRADVNAARTEDLMTDQGAVWDRVAAYRRAEAQAPDGSLLETGRDVAVPDDLRPLVGQRGVVIGIGGTVRSLELFDRADHLAQAWPSILQAAARDAVGAPARRTPGEAARRFVR
jgi:hypothetical protein